MNYTELEKKAERFVTHLFESPSTTSGPFYSLTRSRHVVVFAKEIAWFYNLNEENFCILSVAAWFINTGRLFGELENWMGRSVAILNNFLGTENTPTPFKQLASACLLATTRHPHLESLMEKIMCDADTCYFGMAEFKNWYLLMERETGQTNPGFGKSMLTTLEGHVYFTEYCQLLLNKEKFNNIAWLKDHIKPAGAQLHTE